MRLTTRDRRLLRDMALSHMLSRDQLIRLGYFTSVTRANTRLRQLVDSRMVRRLDVAFYGQSLYMPGSGALEVVGERISPLVSGRKGTPRFLQHALSVTNVRIALLGIGAKEWRFEQQLWTNFTYGGCQQEVRPDGLARFIEQWLVVEADLGHVAPAKLRRKFETYDAFVQSGECQRLWGIPSFQLLVVTTGSRRANRLLRLMPSHAQFELETRTFQELGLPSITSWS